MAFFANKTNLKRLNKNQLYKLLYSQHITPLFRGQIINALELHCPHHTYINPKTNKAYRVFNKTSPEYKTLINTCWEIEQADMQITYLNEA